VPSPYPDPRLSEAPNAHAVEYPLRLLLRPRSSATLCLVTRERIFDKVMR